jgi:hypothetical protein
MTKPGPSVSVLPPPPSTIALPENPVIVPAVKIVLPPKSASTPVSPEIAPVLAFVRFSVAASTPHEPSPGAADTVPALSRLMLLPTMPKPAPEMLPVEVSVIVSVLRAGWIRSLSLFDP